MFYDGKNHIYDLSAQKFFPAMDNETSAYLKESGDQPGIHNRLDGSADHFIRKSTRGHGAQNPSYQEKVAMVLNPGERFRVWYSNNGRMNNLQTWGRKGVYGSTKLSLPVLADIAKALDVSTDTLLFGESPDPAGASADEVERILKGLSKKQLSLLSELIESFK